MLEIKIGCMEPIKEKIPYILFLKSYVHEPIMECFKTQNDQASLATVGMEGQALRGMDCISLVLQAFWKKKRKFKKGL